MTTITYHVASMTAGTDIAWAMSGRRPSPIMALPLLPPNPAAQRQHVEGRDAKSPSACRLGAGRRNTPKKVTAPIPRSLTMTRIVSTLTGSC